MNMKTFSFTTENPQSQNRDIDFTFPFNVQNEFPENTNAFILPRIETEFEPDSRRLRMRATKALEEFNDLLISAIENAQPLNMDEVTQMLSSFSLDNRMDSLTVNNVVRAARKLELLTPTSETVAEWLSQADNVKTEMRAAISSYRNKLKRLKQLRSWANSILSQLEENSDRHHSDYHNAGFNYSSSYLRQSMNDASFSLVSLNHLDLQTMLEHLNLRYDAIVARFSEPLNLSCDDLNETDFAPHLFLGDVIDTNVHHAMMHDSLRVNLGSEPEIMMVNPWLSEVKWSEIFVAYQLYRDKKFFGHQSLKTINKSQKLFGIIASVNFEEWSDKRAETESLRMKNVVRLGTSDYSIRLFRSVGGIYQACLDLKDFEIAPKEDIAFTAMRKMLAMIEMITTVMSQHNQGRLSLRGEPLMVAAGIYYAKWLQSQNVSINQILVEGVPAEQVLTLDGGSDVYQEAKYFVRFVTSTLGDAIKKTELYSMMKVQAESFKMYDIA